LEELEQAETGGAFPQLRASIEHAAEKAVELGELTREEARLIGGYLKRDLEDAGQYLTTTGQDLRAWLRFDLELLEDRMLEFLQRGVDQSRLELLAFEASAAETGDRSGIAAARSRDRVPCSAGSVGSRWPFSPARRLSSLVAACGGIVFVRVTEES
jgi:hypothetical protein